MIENLQNRLFETALDGAVGAIGLFTQGYGETPRLSRDIRKFGDALQGGFPGRLPVILADSPIWDHSGLPDYIVDALRTSLTKPNARFEISVGVGPRSELLQLETRVTRPGIDTWLVGLTADVPWWDDYCGVELKVNEQENLPPEAHAAVRDFNKQFHLPFIHYGSNMWEPPPKQERLNRKLTRQMLAFAQTAGQIRSASGA